MPKCLEMTMNMTAKSEFQPPSGSYESRGTVEQFLDNGLDPPALRRVADDPFAGHQAQLTDEPEDVVHQGSTGHDELIRGANLPEGNLSRSMSVFISE